MEAKKRMRIPRDHAVGDFLSQLNQHRAEAGGHFSLQALEALSDYEVLQLKPVTADFLKMGEAVLRLVAPQGQAAAKKDLAYLAALAERQRDVWGRWEEVLDSAPNPYDGLNPEELEKEAANMRGEGSMELRTLLARRPGTKWHKLANENRK